MHPPMHIIATCTIAAASTLAARAEVITFVNHGEFTWIGIDPNDPKANPDSNALDITKPATQPGDPSPAAFKWLIPSPMGINDVTSGQIIGGPNASVARGELAKAQGAFFFPAKVFGPGEPINAAEDFGLFADTYAYSIANGATLLIGPQATLGVQVIVSGHPHYGWIRLAWNGTEYQPIAWAYESNPETSIVVPPFCDEDLTFDGTVNSQDLNTLLASFGANAGPTGASGDVDGDGDTDSSDLNLLLAKFGTDC